MLENSSSELMFNCLLNLTLNKYYSILSFHFSTHSRKFGEDVPLISQLFGMASGRYQRSLELESAFLKAISRESSTYC